MKAKKTSDKIKEESKSETGAAAALRRWEDQERRESLTVQKLETELTRLRSLKQTDSVLQKIDSIERNLDGAKDQWAQTSKLLLSFERGVSPEKREGEKMLVSDIEKLLEAAWRADRIAYESFCLTISQDAIRCNNEQEFYGKYVQSIRDCRINALRAGIENQHFPAFVLKSFEASL